MCSLGPLVFCAGACASVWGLSGAAPRSDVRARQLFMVRGAIRRRARNAAISNRTAAINSTLRVRCFRLRLAIVSTRVPVAVQPLRGPCEHYRKDATALES